MPASSESDRLRIDVDHVAAGAIVRLAGELDAATADQLEGLLAGLGTPPRLLVLDLHRLAFVDSMGLNQLFRVREWARTHDVDLRLVRAPVHVQRLIALAAMDGSLGPFYADVDAALDG